MRAYIILFMFLTASLSEAKAQQLIYRPVNPAFGGNTFNYQWMLSAAQAQDLLKDPTQRTTTRGATSDQSYLDNFTQSLNQQLLSRISRQLLDRQFGEEGLKDGTFQFGDFTVDIASGVDGIVIKIFDGKGGATSITVPYF